MSDETEAAHVSNVPEAAHVISSSTEPPVSSNDGELQLLRSLPSHAVKDLLSMGVCVRCIFRLLGIQGRISYCSAVSPSILWSMLVGNQDASSPSTCKESEICSVCLGIMQFTYCDDKEILVRKKSANDFAATIAEVVKQEGHQIDSFSLEVSVPPVILENERVVWLYMKRKYGSELWFQERSVAERVSAKDALKCSISNLLETLLGVKSGLSSFRIRLTYAKASNTVENSAERNQGCKKRKTDTDNGLNTTNHESMIAGTDCSDFATSNGNEFVERSFNGLQVLDSSECFKSPLEKVNDPFCLVFLCYMTPIYFGGRYLKYSRNVSQTRWIIDDERMGEASVEEIIGGSILPTCRGDNYKFHAAGREDIDVRMLGSGRPFLVEIQNPRKIPSEVFVKEIETMINNLEHKLVGVRNLKLVGSHGWTLMREGEAEKQVHLFICN